MAPTDKNLDAYCDNNPVMRVDEDGEFGHILAKVRGTCSNRCPWL